MAPPPPYTRGSDLFSKPASLQEKAMAQFKPGKRDEKISGTIGDKQLDCDGIDHGSTTSLDRAMAALASQKGDWVLEANSCINLFIGCDEATKFHDSTVAFCNLVSFVCFSLFFPPPPPPSPPSTLDVPSTYLPAT